MDSRLHKQVKVHSNNVFTGIPDTYHISPEQRQFYEDHGYLVIKELFDLASLYNYKQRFIQVCKGLVDKGKIIVVMEQNLRAKGLTGENIINKIQEIQYDDVFMTYTEHPRLLHVLSQFIGPDIRVINSMVINKPPGSVRHPPHQDLFYFPYRPEEKMIASWTAIDHVNEENGCLYVVPGSHKKNTLYAHGSLPDSDKLYHGILDASTAPPDQWVHLDMSPGDTLFFHPLIIHGSGPNVSKKYRKCITAHYASESCYIIDVRGTLQDEVAKEFEQEAQRKGFTISFENIWRSKSKAVKSHL